MKKKRQRIKLQHQFPLCVSASRRSQAAEWLRQMDQGASATLPKNPSEEEFCLALRNGLILCNVLNKVNPGAVLKVLRLFLPLYFSVHFAFWISDKPCVNCIGGGKSNTCSAVDRRSSTVCNSVF